MIGAGEALQAAVLSVLGSVGELGGAYPGPPLQAAFPYASVEADLETDWSHKSGAGREVRISVVIRDKGERPTRLQRLMRHADAAVAGLAAVGEGWHLVTLRMLRSRVVPPRAIKGGEAWSGVIEYRARLLAED